MGRKLKQDYQSPTPKQTFLWNETYGGNGSVSNAGQNVEIDDEKRSRWGRVLRGRLSVLPLRPLKNLLITVAILAIIRRFNSILWTIFI